MVVIVTSARLKVMQRTKRLIVFLILIALGLGYLRLQAPSIAPTPTPPPTQTGTPSPLASPTAQTPFRAHFLIFTNGTRRIFADAMYHNLASDAFLTAEEPDTVTVTQPITWGDFFATLPFSLSQDCLTTGTGQTFCTGNDGTLKYYLNGERADNALSQIINPGDALLISYGPEEDPDITSQLEQLDNLR